jgi:hypothetical protein
MRPHEAITRRRAFGLAGAAGATYLLTRKRASITAGTHRLTIPIPDHVRGGAARLTLTVHDRPGNIKVIRRALHIPRR